MNPMTANAARAVVACVRPAFPEAQQYLTIGPEGRPAWTADLEAATPFESVREATRMAMRLDSALRAFGLPVGRRDLH